MSWGKNSLVPICTKFISTTTRIQRLRPLLPGNDAYIKVKRMVCLLDRSGFEIGRNFCAAQLTNFYSTPLPVGIEVQVKVQAAYIEIWHQGKCVAQQKAG